jgi:hypothetical protein
MLEIVEIIKRDNLRGGKVITYLYQCYHQNANQNTQKWLEKMLSETIQVFLNQVNAWVLYGQIIDTSG